MKKILSLLLVLTLIFTFSGCFGGKKETKKEETTEEETKARVVNEAQEYLKKNYPDDEFTYVSGRSPNWAYQYYELGFNSKKYDNQQLTVFGTPTEEKNEDGLKKYDYDDNYYQYYMIDDAEKHFYELAEPYLGKDIEVKISLLTNIGAAKKVEKGKNFVESLENDSITPFVYIFGLNEYDKEKENINDFLNCLIENNYDANFNYLYVEDLSEISDMNVDDIGEEHYLECKYFIVSDGVVEEF